MRVIKVCPVLWFRGAWKTFEETGVSPIFPWPQGRQKAIDYARSRFADTIGEIHVYDDDGARVIEMIQIGGTTAPSESGALPVSPNAITAIATASVTA